MVSLLRNGVQLALIAIIGLVAFAYFAGPEQVAQLTGQGSVMADNAGNIAAVAEKIPALHFSADIKTGEITEVSGSSLAVGMIMVMLGLGIVANSVKHHK